MLQKSFKGALKTLSRTVYRKYERRSVHKPMCRNFSHLSRPELLQIALDILEMPTPIKKAQMTIQAARRFENVDSFTDSTGSSTKINELRSRLPDFPARPPEPKLVAPSEMISHRKLKVPLNVYLLHTIAHVEVNAIDTAWDTLLRFDRQDLPMQFYKDWVSIAADEAKHYSLLEEHLIAHGSFYGALPAHAIIWNIASKTKDDIKSRIAIMQMVEEPRGLDAWERLVDRLKGTGDHAGAALVHLICSEEVRHVQLGVEWFKWLCEKDQVDPVETFHKIVRNVNSPIMPPFNEPARLNAGLDGKYYIPLSKEVYR